MVHTSLVTLGLAIATFFALDNQHQMQSAGVFSISCCTLKGVVALNLKYKPRFTLEGGSLRRKLVAALKVEGEKRGQVTTPVAISISLPSVEEESV